MFDLSSLLMFCGASLMLALTPGPDMLLMASRALGQGRRAGFATWVGIALGCYIHGVAVALGLAQIIAASSLAYDIIRYAGAAYLVFLALQVLASKEHIAGAAINDQALPNTALMLSGFLTNLLNPKVIMFMLALLPQFMQPAQGHLVIQALVLITILNAFGFLVNGAVIVFAAQAKARLSGRQKRWPKVLLSSVYTALALRMVAQPR